MTFEEWLKEFYSYYASDYGCTDEECAAMGWDIEQLKQDYFPEESATLSPMDAAWEEYSAMF